MNSIAEKVKKKFAASAAYALLSERGAAAPVQVAGLYGSSISVLASLLADRGPIVIVPRDNDTAEMLRDDLSVLLDRSPLLFEGVQHLDADTQTVQRELLDAAISLRTSDANTIIVLPRTLGLLFPPLAALDRATLKIATGDLFELVPLVTQFLQQGYERKQFVEEEGDIAVRGGLIDLFPIAAPQPIRIELRDIEVESIRTFDVLTQRSIRPLDSVIIPLGVAASAGGDAPSATIAEYLPADALIFLDEPDLSIGAIENASVRERVSSQLAAHRIITHSFVSTSGTDVINFNTRSQPRFGGAVKLLAVELIARAAEQFSVSLFAETNEHAKRLRDLLEETDDVGTLPEPDIHALPIAEGFIVPDEKWAVYTEHELFDRHRITRRPHKDKFRGITLRELRRLEKGDYVVHVDKGIGKFSGMETITVNGVKQECVKLLYRDSDILFVHLNHIDRLQKYVSKEGHVPHLSKLGGTEWVKAKERMKARAMEIAQKLLQIHARRKVEKGHAFPPDNHWQRELEASFMYDDTPDQRKATDDVKRDMEAGAPMDRLVCGDVGYGKTEVAVRAAFKAVQDGKQVAVLVPTTILAQQHFNTFHDRLDKYAVHVEALSRFRSRQEQKEILTKLAAGDVDIIVGTHRILSKDVAFNDLGLLIIDEEHRFGVAAKEKLRERKSTVDTLTLTATPIPRTMNLALVGLRDISVIETPPLNRRPIQTEIIQWDPEVVRRAILHEIHRGGQCFVVHDHVNSIMQLVERISKAVPEARIGVAHGQLSATALENVMMNFMMKKIDVLVCTKIVESGLDIASANTILINHSENFGLAELYQLRGRVGRSNVQAHAYCIVPPLSMLTTTALKRLYALEEFTDLGSGFQLAMRDLELRGAGTILGGEQSGFIDALGFELYTQLLEQAVRELKAKEYKEIFANELTAPVDIVRRDVQVQINADALIPQYYVPDDTERFDLYKRLYQATNDAALQRVREELLDRFGELPPATESLFRAVRLKYITGAIGFDKVTERANEIQFELSTEDAASDAFYLKNFDAVMDWVKANAEISNLHQKNQTLQLSVTLNGRDVLDVAEEIRMQVAQRVTA